MALFGTNSQAYPEDDSLIARLFQRLGENQQIAPTGLASDRAQYDQPAIPQFGVQPQMAMAQPRQMASIAQPQASPLDNMQWPAGPMQANAQIPQYPPPVIQAQPQMQQGPDFGDRISAGAQGFVNSGALLPAIVNGIGGMITGHRMDPHGVALEQQQRNLQVTYAGLVPILGEKQALLATINPEYGKVLLERATASHPVTSLANGWVWDQTQGKAVRAYEPESKKTFTSYKDANGNEVPGVFDPETGFTPIKTATAATPATVAGPDGKQITIPEGVDRKTFVNEISRANAKAAAGEMTETQAKATIFANKMEASDAILGNLQNEGTSLLNRAAEGSSYVPGSATVGHYLQSNDYQKYKQAGSNFITALLRQESGAAINKDEYVRYEKEYLPLPGDGEDVIKQKADARRVAIEGMKRGAGPSYKSPTIEPSTTNRALTGVRWSVE
jgi:hypothetical protein